MTLFWDIVLTVTINENKVSFDDLEFHANGQRCINNLFNSIVILLMLSSLPLSSSLLIMLCVFFSEGQSPKE